MTIDPLLLHRLRQGGMEDGFIRHLHDTVENGSSRLRQGAIHMMSDVAGGPVRHYTRDEGVTAELALDQGMHWTGRALRIAAPRTLPATAVAGLPGRPLSSVVDFPGASGTIVTSVDVDADGNTWIACAAPEKLPPPAKDRLHRRLRHRLRLVLDDERRSGTRVQCHGGMGAALVCSMLLAMFVLPVWSAMTVDPVAGTLLGLGLLAAVTVTFTLPWPERWRDPREAHMRDMKALQTAQGW